MKRTLSLWISVMFVALIALPSFAQEATSSDTDKRIKDLEKKVEQLEKEKSTPTLKAMNAEEVERVLEPVGLSSFYDNGYLVASSADGAFKYWLDGRLQLDAAMYEGSENNLPSGIEARRARIGIKTTLYKDWLAEFDIDFADNAVEIKDMWGGYTGFNNSIIRLGNHKAPFGMESLQSSKDITFMERSYLDAWAPDRRIGLSYSRWGKNWQGSIGAYTEPAGNFDDKDTYTGGGAGLSEQINYVGRFSYAPLNEKGSVLHFGIAAANMKPDRNKIATSGSDLPDRVNASRVVKFDSRPESHVTRSKFLSTGDMKYVNSYDMLGFETAGVFGPMHFLAEYQQTSVNRIETGIANYSDHDYSGYYGQVGWFITGESRPYYSSEGEFGRIVPKGKMGAWELAMRYSTLDLNDKTDVDPILGGSASNLTFGMNWYINANHKLMFDVTMVNNDEYAKPGKDWAPIPPGTSTSLTPVYGDDFTIIAMRYQIAF